MSARNTKRVFGTLHIESESSLRFSQRNNPMWNHFSVVWMSTCVLSKRFVGILSGIIVFASHSVCFPPFF